MGLKLSHVLGGVLELLGTNSASSRTITFPDKDMTVAGTNDYTVPSAFGRYMIGGDTSDAYNIASMVPSGTNVVFTFDTPMDNTNYVAVTNAIVVSATRYKGTVIEVSRTVNDITLSMNYGSTAAADSYNNSAEQISVVIFGGKN